MQKKKPPQVSHLPTPKRPSLCSWIPSVCDSATTHSAVCLRAPVMDEADIYLTLRQSHSCSFMRWSGLSNKSPVFKSEGKRRTIQGDCILLRLEVAPCAFCRGCVFFCNAFLAGCSIALQPAFTQQQEITGAPKGMPL